MDNSHPILFPICLSSTAGPGFVIYDSLSNQNKANQESFTDQVHKYHNFLIFSIKYMHEDKMPQITERLKHQGCSTFYQKSLYFVLKQNLTKTPTNQNPKIFKIQVPVFNSINIWYKTETLMVFRQGTNGSKEKCKLDFSLLLFQHLCPFVTAGTTLSQGQKPPPPSHSHNHPHKQWSDHTENDLRPIEKTIVYLEKRLHW